MNADSDKSAEGIAARKRELRVQARALRDAIPEVEREAAGQRIIEHVLALPELTAPLSASNPAPLVAVYASTGSELPTGPLIEALLARGVGVALPKTVHRASIHGAGARHLDFYRIREYPEGLIRSAWGILEPHESTHGAPLEIDALTLILVPALQFDPRRHRLGYGGGYYDRLLAHPHRAQAIGLGYAAQFSAAMLPIDPWDIPLDGICGEAGIHLTAFTNGYR